MKDLSSEALLRKFTSKIIKNQASNLFKNNDKILVGVSGGKDSLLLIEVLGELCKKHRYTFQIKPVHIKIKRVGYNINFEAIEEICTYYGFDFQIIETEIDFDPEHKKGPCFVCSWHRRKLLFSTAREMGCNKIALGHHMDDAVQTLLLNMIYHGSISSMPATLSMFRGELELIRPLLPLNEKDIIHYQSIRNYPQLVKDCPYGATTKRNTMKELVEELEKIHPAAKQNLFKAMSKVYSMYLPEGEKSVINGLNEIHPLKNLTAESKSRLQPKRITVQDAAGAGGNNKFRMPITSSKRQ
jgi:tRNA(Ile)-lysidine synthase TilS/MesJ